MALQLLAGLGKIGAKKLAKRKVKPFGKDKEGNEFYQPNFKLGEGWTDSGDRHRQTYFGLSSPSPLIGGTTKPLKIKPARHP